VCLIEKKRMTDMGSGKWITDISAETGSVDAARRVLGLRLASLRDCVGNIFRERDDELEDVHQLRVAVRRASAAVDIFEPCLAKKAYRIASKRLRRLRRAAGRARDLDVFMMHCTSRLEQAQPEDAQALDLLSGYAVAERIPAQEQLNDACTGYPFEFERWMSETIAALVSPPREIAQLQELGRRSLRGLFDRIRRVADLAAPSYDEMHAVRVVAKRLRYSMEIFAGCFADALRDELYPRVVELQEILGVVSDAHIGLARTESLLRGLSTLLPSRCERWIEPLERFAEESRSQRAQGCEQLEAWKACARRTGFETLVNSLLAGDTTGRAERAFPITRAS
jgi:CHAD domain-containing protein